MNPTDYINQGTRLLKGTLEFIYLLYRERKRRRRRIKDIRLQKKKKSIYTHIIFFLISGQFKYPLNKKFIKCHLF